MSTLLKVLAEKIPISVEELETIVRTASFRYKVYDIPKRSGRGVRTIAQPAPEVKWIQSVVCDEFLNKWPIHLAATAYRKNQSTADHARVHAGSSFLLKLDFENFFPSILAADVAHHIRLHTDLDDADQRRLTTILTWRNKKTRTHCLSIGAPSSPLVSNSMLYEFDSRVGDFCHGAGVAYSRYADDLAFSTNKPDVLKVVNEFVREVIPTIRYPRLTLNIDKTVNVSKRYRRSLVGLVLTPDGQVSLGREQKKLLRAQIHWHLTGRLRADEEGSLRGRLAYALSAEPTFVARLADHFGSEALSGLGISTAAISKAMGKR